jgi:MoxR-like ATPase
MSPRGSLALAQAARATALFSGRDYVIPEDITGNIADVCTHRVVPKTTYGAAAESVSDILGAVLRTVPSPA